MLVVIKIIKINKQYDKKYNDSFHKVKRLKENKYKNAYFNR